MKLLRHCKAFFTFWQPSVARKMTFYLTLFGLLIFYITSVGDLVIAQKRLAVAITRMVRHEVAKIPGSYARAYWWKSVDRKQPVLRELAELLLSLTHTGHMVTDVSIYTQSAPESSWHRLRLDADDVLRKASYDDETLKKLDLHSGGFVGPSGSDFYISSKKIAFFVRLSDENDPFNAFFRIDILRQGIGRQFFGRWDSLIAVFPIALIIIRIVAYLFARAMAQPIELLSKAAERVAQGDLSVQVPAMGKTELGTLGNNFNKMVQGLQEWQRIKAIELELEKGRAIQQDFLPTDIPCPPSWDIATCFCPAREVSGDFYDVFDLPGGKIGLAIADVCDKGVGSALYMALIRSLIRVYAEQSLCPAFREGKTALGAEAANVAADPTTGLRAVKQANDYLAKHHGREGMFATLFFGILDPESGQLSYINGGHEPLYIVGVNGLKSELPPTGPAIGAIEDASFKIGALKLAPGELLLGLTDGVTEARNLSDELFTRKRLRDLLSQPAKSAGELLESIRQQVFTFVGTAPDADDVTMLAVQRLV